MCCFLFAVKAGIIRIWGHKKLFSFLSMYAYLFPKIEEIFEIIFKLEICNLSSNFIYGHTFFKISIFPIKLIILNLTRSPHSPYCGSLGQMECEVRLFRCETVSKGLTLPFIMYSHHIWSLFWFAMWSETISVKMWKYW